jgi:hypothetical protein
MTELGLANLNILLKLDYNDVTIVDKFKYFIKVMTELWLANLNILLQLDYYYDRTRIGKFKYFIKIRL